MSLINQLRKELKERYPRIYSDNNSLLGKFNLKVSKSRFWNVLIIYIIFIVLVVLYTYYINWDIFQCLNINFDDNVKIFTTSIITLVSMNLFVTNLLFTHLKDERDDIQSIIDNRIYFKFITYLGFTIILSILSLYFISPSINNISVKSNVFTLIFFSFIFYIIKLISLYNTVFEFINKEKRIKIIKDELESEFSRAFYNYFIKKEFKKRYVDIMEKKHGFTQFSFFDERFEKNSFTKKTDTYLNDIHLNKLQLVLEKITATDKKYFSLELDQKFDKNKIHDVLAFNTEQNIKIHKYFIFKKNSYLNKTIERENLTKLLNKVNNNTLSNKFNELNENLINIGNIYEQYLNLDKHD